MARKNTNRATTPTTMLTYVCPECGYEVGIASFLRDSVEATCYRRVSHARKGGVTMTVAPAVAERARRALQAARR